MAHIITAPKRMKLAPILFAIGIGLSACATVAQDAQTPIVDNGPVGLGQRVYVDGPVVTPLQVLEDSRCPANVMCVWAGQVRLKVRVATGRKSREMILINNQPVQVADGQLTLTGVTPDKVVGSPGMPPPYRFTFQFHGGL